MRHTYLNIYYLSCLVAILCAPANASTNRLAEPNMIDRILHPNRDKESQFQNKIFNPGGSQFNQSLKTGDYAGVKNFQTKDFTSKTFEGTKKNWLGKLLFPEKKLPEKFQSQRRAVDTKFDTKILTEKNFNQGGKKSTYATRDAYATSEITPRGATQGAIDNDQQLQEAIKKGLSIDDIRKLLNKGP